MIKKKIKLVKEMGEAKEVLLQQNRWLERENEEWARSSVREKEREREREREGERESEWGGERNREGAINNGVCVLGGRV